MHFVKKGIMERKSLWIFYFLLGLSTKIYASTTESAPSGPQGPIFIVEPPSSLIVPNNKGSIVPCSAYGRPAPVTEWVTVDGNPVDGYPELLTIFPNNSLYFHTFDTSVPEVHSQTYRCTAKNVVGSVISRSMRVTADSISNTISGSVSCTTLARSSRATNINYAVFVDQISDYKVNLNDVYVMRGGTAVFNCLIVPFHVKNYVLVVNWSKGTFTMDTEERISILDGGDLHIRDVREEDSFNTFRCTARNTLTGEEKYSPYAYLHIHDPPKSWTTPEALDSLRAFSGNINQSVELPCVANGFPLPTYRWYKNGEQVKIDDTRLMQRGGNLLLKNITVEDNGDYVCNASNKRGVATIVRKLVVNSPLAVMITPVSQIIDSSQSASFECSVTGHPVKSIDWYKDGRPLVSDYRVKIRSQTVLIISNVTRFDQGMYQCMVQNEMVDEQAAGQLSLGAAHPIITKEFETRFTHERSKLSIHCVVAGNPIPSVQWYLDGKNLTSDDHYDVYQTVTEAGEVISYVNISSLRIEDGGEYTCNATNDVGSEAYSIKVNIYGKPFVKEMKNITAIANEELSIHCYVSGYPVSRIIWRKGESELPSTHLQRVVNGTLTITKVQKPQDAGIYICTAQNSQEIGMSRSVFVEVLESPRIDSFSLPRKEQGDRVMINCVVSSGDLPINITWLKDGKQIPPGMGIITQTHTSYMSSLSIPDAGPIHKGNYTCQASNAAATDRFTAELYVDVPPRWVKEPQNAFVILQQSVTVDCLATGTPEPGITWTKDTGNKCTPARSKKNGSNDYKPLNALSDEIGHYKVDENGSLTIHDAQEADHGWYMCHAQNGVGLGLSKRVNLTVHVPARFDVPGKNYSVLKGQNVTMECQAIGDKPLSITWNFNGETFGTESGHSRRKVELIDTSRGRLSRLIVKPTERDDTGLYTCTAKNQFGYDSLTLRLTILERPEAPENLTVLKVLSREAKLSWSKPFDGNSPLTSYILQYMEATSSTWDEGNARNITVKASEQSTTLEHLHPSFTYKLRIRGSNSVGIGVESKEVLVQMMEEKPAGPPQDIRVTAMGSQSLEVKWKPPQLEERNGVILGYYVGYRKIQDATHFQFITKSVAGEEDTEKEIGFMIQNLEKFTKYAVNVKAYNQQGVGPPTDVVEVFTLEDVPSQPPSDVQATALSSESIKIVWSPPPLFTLHGVLQGFKVMYKLVRSDEDETDASSITSSGQEAVINGLEKFTNYSIQVLAYTRKGEGVRSDAIYVRTQEDVPEEPAAIKAIVMNDSCVHLSWRPPCHKNGVIIKYRVYYWNETESNMVSKLDILTKMNSFTLCDLVTGEKYSFYMTASTIIGESGPSDTVNAIPSDTSPARIATFSQVLLIPWQETVLLPCVAMGNPLPFVSWSVSRTEIKPDSRRQLLSNGSLLIEMVTGVDAANFTCTARNIHGSDSITIGLSVQVDSSSNWTPPNPPILSLAAVTISTIQVNWLSGSNGGSKIKGFLLRYRKEHDDWREMELGRANRSYTATGLLCGTSYKFTIRTFNEVGTSIESNMIEAQTNGSVPIMPVQSSILLHVNTTSLELDMSTWKIVHCPIKFFSIKYQVSGDSTWEDIANDLKPNTTIFTVHDLQPATWYQMKVTAHSAPGSTECLLKFSTLMYTGKPLPPEYIYHKSEPFFYERVYIMVPLCAAIVFILVLIIGLALYCRRRRDFIRYKENVTCMRRDITAETSLMNDLDKRQNLDLSPGQGTPDPFSNRNVNLLISLHSDDNIHDNTQSWIFNDGSKTTSDNASIEKSDDEDNINPYATFNELKLVFSDHPPINKKEQEFDKDSISLEKEEAQRAMLSLQEAEDQGPGPLPAGKIYGAKREGYDNQGVVLSPRKYASADQIHALFTMAPPRPQSAYSKQKSGSRSSPSDRGTGSQRHSLISSVTTVSSSRDELLEAFENAKRNPPPPIVYETESDYRSSQPTDSSGTTEPGICQFTQSPPRPDEQREASCEVPAYDGTYEDPVSVGHRRRRRKRSRVRGCERGGTHARRNPSQSSSMSLRKTNRGHVAPTAEVTYVFGSSDSSTLPAKPYTAYMFSTQAATRGGRGTPHVRVRYDTAVQAPSNDESSPLVVSLPSPRRPAPDEEESVSLIDRFYRPVLDRGASHGGRMEGEEDKCYTEDYTVV